MICTWIAQKSALHVGSLCGCPALLLAMTQRLHIIGSQGVPLWAQMPVSWGFFVACNMALHAADSCLRTMVACDAPDHSVSLSSYAIVGSAAFLRWSACWIDHAVCEMQSGADCGAQRA